MNKELSLKQQKFCDLYLISGNAQDAYKEAYRCKTDVTARVNASKLLTKPNVSNYIANNMLQLSNKNIATAEDVLLALTSILNDKETEEQLIVIDSEVVRVQKKISKKDKLKAAELLGKRYRLFVDRVEANVDTNICIDLGDENEY